MSRTIYIGFDSREAEAFFVARESIRQYDKMTPIYGLVLEDLRAAGLYTRPMEIRMTQKRRQMWDLLSDAPMATEFANSRFLIGHLSGSGYALFMDCDVLVRCDIRRLFEICERDPSKAVWCVKHEHKPVHGMKMDGQQQTKYARKNWSSVMVWNVDHPAHDGLTLEAINTLPGRDLHRFCWVKDEDIGELGSEWNLLVGASDPVPDAKIVHFTNGGPWIYGFERVDYSDEWRAARVRSTNSAHGLLRVAKHEVA